MPDGVRSPYVGDVVLELIDAEIELQRNALVLLRCSRVEQEGQVGLSLAQRRLAG